ncbi:MAG: class I SAM-dependent methyltransferase [Ferruginibacter sp.]
MFSRFQLAKKYISYYITAQSGKGHGVHSPFVFDFIKNVLNDNAQYPEYDKIEALRKKLLADERMIEVEDFGARLSSTLKKIRKVKQIAGTSLKTKKYAQLLFRIAKYYKASTIIELGTSLGITTAYLASANATNVYSLEGSGSIAGLASHNIKCLGITNTTIVTGVFEDTLNDLLAKVPKPDLVFVDGNHRKFPTLNYFSALLNSSKNTTLFIFDDIYWSNEMEEAWTQIKNDASVTITIDLFFIGIVLLTKDFKVKQHFKIRF